MVDVIDEASLSYVHRMVDAQVSVYIYWGTCGQFLLCDPLPESQASLGGQQLPSVNTLPMPEANLPSEHQPIPSNSLPDPQVSASAHPMSVFMGDLPEVQAASTMHLQDVLQMWYGFNYSKYSGAAPQTNASLGSLAVKISEGEATRWNFPSHGSDCFPGEADGSPAP